MSRAAAPGGSSVLARAAELEAAGAPFALAAVVAVRRPTSAHPGSWGIVHPDRSIEGWVGGSCAQPIVVREALRSLSDGQPRLLRLSKDGGSGGERADGVLEFLMTCHSGGTLQVYVEPHLPRPALWVAGATPVATALAELGGASGLAVSLVDSASDLAALRAAAPPYVVVATQGQWDEDAIASALGRDPAPAYVGLVASPTRAAAVREYLLGEGVPAERVAWLRAPAGLDLGAETPGEIALSILAELVQLRRSRTAARPVGRPAGPAAEPEWAVERHKEARVPGQAGDDAAGRQAASPEIVLVDPVCGMTVDAGAVRHVAAHGGITYAFCCAPCRSQFLKHPEAFVPAAGPVAV